MFREFRKVLIIENYSLIIPFFLTIKLSNVVVAFNVVVQSCIFIHQSQNTTPQRRVVSRAGLFGSGSGPKLTKFRA